LPVLAAQPRQLFALGAAEHVALAGSLALWRALVSRIARHPRQDALRAAFELAPKLCRAAPGAHQLDHLLLELRRVRRLRRRHIGLPSP
jgi:hypothetical protein